MILFNHLTYNFSSLINFLEIILELKHQILILDLIFVIGIISLAGRIGKEALSITSAKAINCRDSSFSCYFI